MKKYVLFCLIIFILSSCRKTYVDSISFNVTTASTTYKVGDTISFLFSGNADNVTFYPGTSGFKYENKDRISENGVPILTFSTLKELNTVDTSLSLLVSTDFNGIYDSVNVLSAKWTDITARATLSTAATKDTIASGSVDLSDFTTEQKPIYIAYKFIGKSNPTIAQSKWTVNHFLLTNNLKDSSKQVVATQADASFIGINVKNSTNKWVVSATQIQIKGGAKNEADNEDWAISRPLRIDRVLPDNGYALKNISSNLTSYKVPNTTFQGYLSPGKYKATFVASNKTAFKNETIIKEIEITIVP